MMKILDPRVRLKKGDTIYVPLIVKHDDSDQLSTTLAHFPGESFTTVAVKRQDIQRYTPAFAPGDKVCRSYPDAPQQGVILAVHKGQAWVAMDGERWPQTFDLVDLYRLPEEPLPIPKLAPKVIHTDPEALDPGNDEPVTV